MPKYTFIDMIRKENQILVAEILPNKMKKKILELEMKRLNEIVPLFNKGINQSFNEEEQIVVIKQITDEESDSEYKSALTLKTNRGQIVGEEINDEKTLAELRKKDNVYFLSDNFVTFIDHVRESGEKQFFEVSSAEPEFITPIDLKKYTTSVTVGIPSTESDIYIKDCFEIPNETFITTAIIGFTSKN